MIQQKLRFPKKRGRKPKGGKIISINKEVKKNNVIQPNIILHLKCSSEDLTKNKKNYYDSYNNEEYSNYDINDSLKEEIKLKTTETSNQISNLNNINENVIQKKLNY